MAESLNEEEIRVLDYLKRLVKEENRRIEFNINDVSASLSMPEEKFEVLLISLEEKGLLKIIKAPPSKLFLDMIKRKCMLIDSAFLTGEITLSEYTKKWEEIINCMPDAVAKSKLVPLPPTELGDMIDGLNNLLNYLKKLFQEEVDQEIYNRLTKMYNEEFRHSLDLIRRYLDSIEFTIEISKNLIETEAKEIKLIEIDEKIRGVDRSNEKKVRKEKIDKAQKAIEEIRRKIKSSETEEGKEKINELNNKLKELEEEYELVQTRMVIESESIQKLEKVAEALRSEIENVKNEIESLTNKIAEQSRKKDVKGNLENILEEAKKLSQKKIFLDENLKMLNEIVSRITALLSS